MNNKIIDVDGRNFYISEFDNKETALIIGKYKYILKIPLYEEILKKFPNEIIYVEGRGDIYHINDKKGIIKFFKEKYKPILKSPFSDNWKNL